MYQRSRSQLASIPARSFGHFIQKCLEFAGSRGMTQLAQRLGLDLANAFAGHAERLANFLERPLRAVLDTKTHPDDLLFPRTESPQHVGSPLLPLYVDE